MSRRTAAVVAWTLVVVSAVVGFTGVGLDLALGDPSLSYVVDNVLVSAIFLTSGVVGALVASRLPTNPIGWIFLGLVASLGLAGAADGYIALAVDDGRVGGFTPWVAWYSAGVFLALFATLLYTLLLFPDGRLPTRRWRVVLWAGTAGLVVISASVLFQPGPLDDYPRFTNPVGIESEVLTWLSFPGFLAFVAALVGSAVSLVVRFRRAQGVERQQVTLLMAAGVVATAAFLASGVIVNLSGFGQLSTVITLVGILAIPVAIGVAMLRYRLYEIDRVISRTLVYGALTVILGAGYVGLVLAGQAVFSSFAGGSNLAIAVSTLVVAALFLPLRSRVQRVVDRRFFRRRYDAQQTLATFGARLRQETDIDSLRRDLLAVVDEAMQPDGAGLWLRRPG